MSVKAKARIEAKKAVGDLAKVNKVDGQLIVLRSQTGGRERDWRRTVKRLIRQALPNWEVADENYGVVVFSSLLGKGEKP